MPVVRRLDLKGVLLKLSESWRERPKGYLYSFETFFKKFLPKFRHPVKKQPIFPESIGALNRG
jgi:hypothetical protein